MNNIIAQLSASQWWEIGVFGLCMLGLACMFVGGFCQPDREDETDTNTKR